MQIWYLSPFLLALLVWWVATRKRPDDKEKWTWLALGVCAGAVLMFTLVFFSERQVTGLAGGLDSKALSSGDHTVRVTLEDDEAKEILPPTRIGRNRAIAVGSLQITLRDVTEATAELQIHPSDELEYFGNVNGWWPKDSTGKANLTRPPLAVEAELGRYLDFGYHGRFYRLGLLETEPPLWGLASPEIHDMMPSHAVIRLVDRGTYSIISGETSNAEGARPVPRDRSVAQGSD
ncbi:MAG TPA: hypothetical protein VJ276_18920 [Thermoanaerobaculia bacterium]|nr:hypothetical protein [Thermoanaerobaculia bacterium]